MLHIIGNIAAYVMLAFVAFIVYVDVLNYKADQYPKAVNKFTAWVFVILYILAILQVHG